MKSLRSRLTAGLLIGTGLLLAAGGFVLQRVIASRLRRDYDAALIARARSLATLTEQKDGRVWLQFTDEVMPDFASKQSPDYFQIWLAGGPVIERSRSLGTRDLPRSGVRLDRPLLSDLTLPDGRRGRKVEISFHPLSEEEEDRLRDTGQSSGPETSTGALTVTLELAHGREELDAFLLSIQVTLALVAAGLLAGTAALVAACWESVSLPWTTSGFAWRPSERSLWASRWTPRALLRADPHDPAPQRDAGEARRVLCPREGVLREPRP